MDLTRILAGYCEGKRVLPVVIEQVIQQSTGNPWLQGHFKIEDAQVQAVFPGGAFVVTRQQKDAQYEGATVYGCIADIDIKPLSEGVVMSEAAASRKTFEQIDFGTELTLIVTGIDHNRDSVLLERPLSSGKPFVRAQASISSLKERKVDIPNIGKAMTVKVTARHHIGNDNILQCTWCFTREQLGRK